jgi:hypothetical protein
VQVNGFRITTFIGKYRAYGSIRQALLLLSQVLDLDNDHVATIPAAALKKTASRRVALDRADYLQKTITYGVESIIKTKVDDLGICVGLVTAQ